MCICSLRYPARNAHAPYCQLWPASLCNIFPHYVINGMIFEKSYWTQNVFWFSLQLLSETFVIVRWNERYMIKKYICLHVLHSLFLSDFNKNWIFSTDFPKILKYRMSWKFVQCEPSCSMRTDGQTEGHDEANSRFSQFCERSWNRHIADVSGSYPQFHSCSKFCC